jgi:hypothetical protein
VEPERSFPIVDGTLRSAQPLVRNFLATPQQSGATPTLGRKILNQFALHPACRHALLSILKFDISEIVLLIVLWLRKGGMRLWQRSKKSSWR